jgi:AbrB family looped-hinge helix DNA binding protein
MEMKAPEGKFMATVKVGEKGQIVIPKGARELFDIQPGDTLLLMADKKQGIALVRNEVYSRFMDAVFQAQRHPVDPEEDDHE